VPVSFIEVQKTSSFFIEVGFMSHYMGSYDLDLLKKCSRVNAFERKMNGLVNTIWGRCRGLPQTKAWFSLQAYFEVKR
jgi:hypothetical protein